MSTELRKDKRKETLEDKVTSTIAIASLAISILFMSSSITGNVISSLNQTSSNFMGGVLFLIGIIAAFVYFRKSKPGQRVFF